MSCRYSHQTSKQLIVFTIVVYILCSFFHNQTVQDCTKTVRSKQVLATSEWLGQHPNCQRYAKLEQGRNTKNPPGFVLGAEKCVDRERTSGAVSLLSVCVLVTGARQIKGFEQKSLKQGGRMRLKPDENFQYVFLLNISMILSSMILLRILCLVDAYKV